MKKKYLYRCMENSIQENGSFPGSDRMYPCQGKSVNEYLLYGGVGVDIFGLFSPDIEKIITEKDVEGLIKALRHKRDFKIRWKAAEALGKIKDERAVDSLMRTLQDENEYVRKAAAQALGEIQDRRVIEPLVRALKDEDKNVRKMAAHALRKIKDERVIERLIETLRNEWIQNSMAMIPRNVGNLQEIRSLLKILGDEWIQKDIAQTLGEIQDEKMVNSLIEALEKKEATIRKVVVKALGFYMERTAIVCPEIQTIEDEYRKSLKKVDETLAGIEAKKTELV